MPSETFPKTDEERREQLATITTELYHAGLVTAMGGNLSIRCASRNDALWITPSQIFKGGLRSEQMILVDFSGQKLDVEGNPEGKPSMEASYHAGILSMRPEINAVVHTHAPLATVFAMCDMEMKPITTEAVSLLNFPVVPWALGGTRELAAFMIEYVGSANVNGAFLRNHGLVTLGANLREAADITYTVEHTIKILLACKLVGKEPSLIPQATVDLLTQHAGKMAV